jgi:hypothetical protein
LALEPTTRVGGGFAPATTTDDDDDAGERGR